MTIDLAQPTLPHLPDELLARWRKIPVAVAVDLAPDCQISPEIRALRQRGPVPQLCARAVTVRCDAPDFGAILKALRLTGPGQVLVIDAGGHPGHAVIGDVLGGFLHGRGAAGIICNGAVRDTANLAGFEGFSVYARHVNPRGPVGTASGSVNHPVMFGGAQVNPGDLILGDDDGLATLPVERLASLIEAAEAKLRLEVEWTEKLARGVPVESIFGLD